MRVACVHQFHDILAGTSLESAYEACYEDYRKSLWLAGEVQETALAALAGQIDARRSGGCLGGSGEGRPLLVVNPHPWPQVAPVEVNVLKETDPLPPPRKGREGD
jgi:alpha-mannosidase